MNFIVHIIILFLDQQNSYLDFGTFFKILMIESILGSYKVPWI